MICTEFTHLSIKWFFYQSLQNYISLGVTELFFQIPKVSCPFHQKKTVTPEPYGSNSKTLWIQLQDLKYLQPPPPTPPWAAFCYGFCCCLLLMPWISRILPFIFITTISLCFSPSLNYFPQCTHYPFIRTSSSKKWTCVSFYPRLFVNTSTFFLSLSVTKSLS